MPTGLGVMTLVFLFGGYPLLPGEGHALREVGLDRFGPTEPDRQIDTTSAHFFFLEKTLDPMRLRLRLGMTGSRATGQITQLEGAWETGNLRTTSYDSPAWGIGPTAEAQVVVGRVGSAQFTMDVSGGVLLYDRSFPAGGHRYNGIFQLGPTASFAMGNGQSLALSWRWMHVSNGQGPGPHNPAYEGQGLSVRYRWAI